jgi:TPR repeat protein
MNKIKEVLRKILSFFRLVESAEVLQMRELADNGDLESQYQLALMHARGDQVGKNLELAAAWCLKAANGGHAEAQCHLGLIYRLGLGVPMNGAEAVRWTRLSAEQGVAAAQYSLGLMYSKGLDVPQDLSECARWYGLAAAGGSQEAQFKLALLHISGQVHVIDSGIRLSSLEAPSSRDTSRPVFFLKLWNPQILARSVRSD